MKALTIDSQSNSNIDDLVQRHPNVTHFFLHPGKYHLTRQLEIDRDNIVFAGLGDAGDVHIVQDTPDANAIVIKGSYVALNHVSIYCEHGSGIALTHSNVSYVQVEHCQIFGSETYFAVFIAGRSHAVGSATIAGFEAGELDSHNTFDNNIVYCKWSGDAVSFSMQKHGSVRNNIVRGGKLAVYMTQDCVVANNRVFDSTSHGIICSMPSRRLRVQNNMLYRSHASAIAVRPQAEHGDYTPADNAEIVVEGNVVLSCEYIGIEVENVRGISIVNNRLRNIKNIGIYLLRARDCLTRHNRLISFARGVMIDVESTRCTVRDNWLYSMYPNEAQHAVLVETSASDSHIDGNALYGRFTSKAIENLALEASPPTSIGINVEDDHIKYAEEMLLWAEMF